MKIKDQFVSGNNTVLLFDNLKMANTKFILVDGKKFEMVICFDLPNAIAIKGNGNFKGKEIDFVN